MKTMTVACALLACVLTGCAMPDSSSRSSMSSRENRGQTDPAVYHAANFGEENNQPFNGMYSSSW
ncbi:hypothetical protein AKI39_11920 [Bordetella sp. H567]|uniref:hypothetical protein n=1 Tax=Bordetella sp. H567 TaxID=1697043 RepID=UPI00081CE57A|nr:hypothetical protein [Bordetella sp. H567]AOB31252.1 hypothetical protein AKI39_11920 [Bordetella sp. H567]